MPSWKKVIVSGSDASLNSVSTNTSVCASGNIRGTVICSTSCFVGNFCGTASSAVTATTATTATTANNSICLNGAPQGCYVMICGTQTVGGVKTFSSCIVGTGGFCGTASNAVTATTANNSICLGSAPQGCYVMICGNQAVGGVKTFSSCIVGSGGFCGVASSAVTATTATTAGNSNCLGSAPQVCYTMNCGTQTVGGVKTFSSCIVASGGLCGTASSAVTATSATTATTAGNSNCLGSAPQVCYTMNCGTQTVAGVKTFSSCIIASGGLCGTASSAVTATTATTAGNANCLGSAPQVCYVMTCGNQTIGGVKTFTCPVSVGTATIMTVGVNKVAVNNAQNGGTVSLIFDDEVGQNYNICLPTESGTLALTNGTISNANCLGSAPQVCYTMNCGTQTVAGVKTFSSCIIASGGVCGTASSAVTATSATTATTAGNSNCLGSAPQVCYVMMCGNQTVGGVKTFSGTVCGSGLIRAVNLCATTSICGPMVCVSGTVTAATLTSAGTVNVGTDIIPTGTCLIVRTVGTIRACIDAVGICTPGTLRAANVCAITSISGPSLSVSGTATVGSLVETSTKTLKSNITPYSSSIEKLKQLQPVTFLWKHTGRPDIGLIAEDVELVLPELVHKDPTGCIVGINYGKLSTIFINVIKEQQTRIETLESKLNCLLK